MADTLPITTASPALAELPPPASGRYVPSVEEMARQAAAVEHLAQVAAGEHLTADELVRQALLAEYAHLKCDADVDAYTQPFPYLRRGVTARRGGTS
ncbi:hypothetical protein HYE82_18785 [Streptomyces sp. BR123]|uniref:hypothetical protein n=1 Tax=Streptomyces sp. BR123 TaxID=2749828 RepID=UPI0015C4C06B|nr:hypothetical protein [Streptomyces sp. BR123]NXY96399.1 hypothetical protein [Streptomyces sp. BR123]